MMLSKLWHYTAVIHIPEDTVAKWQSMVYKFILTRKRHKEDKHMSLINSGVAYHPSLGNANESMFDSNDSDEPKQDIGDDSDDDNRRAKRLKVDCDSKSKAAHEMGRGMLAIADAFKNSQPNNDLANLLRTSQEENRNVMERIVQMQERQNALMEQLMTVLAQRK
ncbi:hypothetical protein AC1031_015796 [Aphanomyces cochlioides]|nr:hypothetical protein AC1031_015796 [Aphanomyces cochlioides]